MFVFSRSARLVPNGYMKICPGGAQVSNQRPLLSQLLAMLAPSIRSSLGELQAASQRDDLAAAGTELYASFGIYTGYGFDGLGHMCRGFKEACVAGLMLQSSALAHFANMSEQLLKKIPAYQG